MGCYVVRPLSAVHLRGIFDEQQSDNNAYFGSMYHMRMICFLVYMML
jgi:hypothetical protein